MMEKLFEALLYLRVMLFFVCAYGLFLISTLARVREPRSHMLMRLTCGLLALVFLALGLRATLTAAHLSTNLADLLLTPALVAAAFSIAVSVRYLVRASMLIFTG